MQSKDERRVTGSDVIARKGLGRDAKPALAKLRASDANFRVTRTQPGRPNVQSTDATADVVFTFAWTANGRNYDKKAKFRLSARKTGDSWAIATLRALDKLE